MCTSSSIAKASTGIAASVVESSSSFPWNPGMFLYSPVPELFPPRKKYYPNLKQMIVRQSTHHRTERRSSQLPPIHKIERRYSGRKNRARFQQTKFSTNTCKCPSSLLLSLCLSVQTLLQLNVHLLYMEKYSFRVRVPNPKPVSP